MTKGRIALVHIASPLLAGVASYVIWRAWLPFFGRHAALWPTSPGPLRAHFADAMWGWALGAFVALMWLDEKRAHRVVWVVVAAAVAAGLELFQGMCLGWGAFDRGDLVVQPFAVIASAVVVTWLGGGAHRWTSASEAH
jgi:hypothetical protein